MLTITREDTTIVITAEAEYPIQDTSFAAKWNAGTDWAARLLWYHLTRRMQTRLSDIRQHAYAEGWKDAKGHHTKRTFFRSDWKA